MNTRSVAGWTKPTNGDYLWSTPPPVDYVVLAFPRGGPPVEVAREDAQWKAQAVAFEERRRGVKVEIEERTREAA